MITIHLLTDLVAWILIVLVSFLHLLATSQVLFFCSAWAKLNTIIRLHTHHTTTIPHKLLDLESQLILVVAEQLYSLQIQFLDLLSLSPPSWNWCWQTLSISVILLFFYIFNPLFYHPTILFQTQPISQPSTQPPLSLLITLILHVTFHTISPNLITSKIYQAWPLI